jgi:hypothetical protein
LCYRFGSGHLSHMPQKRFTPTPVSSLLLIHGENVVAGRMLVGEGIARRARCFDVAHLARSPAESR